MGTRINYLVTGGGNDGLVCAVLYSNSHTLDAIEVFEGLAATSAGPNDLIDGLRGVTYGEDDGLKRVGQRVFSFDSLPYDHESVVRVAWENSKAVITKHDNLDCAPVLRLNAGPACERCAGPLRIDGFCKDVTCPHSDWPQEADIDNICTMGSGAYVEQTGLQRRVRIDAEAYTDDRKASVSFDAGPYFFAKKKAGALEPVLNALVAINFGGDYAADEIAEFFRDDKTRGVFEATGVDDAGDMVGFECNVDPESLYVWLSVYAPEVAWVVGERV